MVISGCEEYPLAAHSYTVKQDTVAPGCTTPGYTVYKCATCDLTENRDVTDPLGHDYADGVCTRCGAADPDYNPGGNDDNSGGNVIGNIFAKIRDFFQRIIDFFRNLFKR